MIDGNLLLVRQLKMFDKLTILNVKSGMPTGVTQKFGMNFRIPQGKV